ncbi:Tricarboxylate transport sensor protein TctE [Klebsiella michiganensis]|nr:Tricarboxylate transport sensor protein TctE [Klebsiella michiganensis]
MRWGKPQSLFAQLLLFLGLPLVLLWGLSAFNSYVSALQAATQAYDRTLLSSAARWRNAWWFAAVGWR